MKTNNILTSSVNKTNMQKNKKTKNASSWFPYNGRCSLRPNTLRTHVMPLTAQLTIVSCFRSPLEWNNSVAIHTLLSKFMREKKKREVVTWGWIILDHMQASSLFHRLLGFPPTFVSVILLSTVVCCSNLSVVVSRWITNYIARVQLKIGESLFADRSCLRRYWSCKFHSLASAAFNCHTNPWHWHAIKRLGFDVSNFPVSRSPQTIAFLNR